MNILITGGAGYLGSILVPELLTDGHNVTVLDTFMYGQASLCHVCADPDLELVRGDARRRDTLLSLLRAADVIIPLAGYVGAPLCAADPLSASLVNRDAILMLLSNLSVDQRVLMPTTNSAYGTATGVCTEASPLRPLSQYAREKVEVEEALMQHENAISLRLATVFGMSPRMRLDLLVNDFVYRAVRDRFVVLFEGGFRRNYIHVRDVARAFQHGLNSFERMRGEVYNVGLSEANVSKRELCEAIQKWVPDFTVLDAPIGRDPDQRDYIVSNARIEATGYRPIYSLNAGIRELIKGYQMLRPLRYSNV